MLASGCGTTLASVERRPLRSMAITAIFPPEYQQFLSNEQLCNVKDGAEWRDVNDLGADENLSVRGGRRRCGIIIDLTSESHRGSVR